MWAEKRHQSRLYAYKPRFRRRFLVLAFIAVCYIVFIYFPEPELPKKRTENFTSPNKLAPEYEEEFPKFVHTSPFRKDPDFEYEARIDAMLQEVERAALAENGGDYSAKDRIWQIMPEVKDRGSDSKMLENKNNGWEYTPATDAWAAAFIADTLSKAPEIATMYQAYPYNVLRADLLRYLVLWYYGGFYADMDAFPARPIKQCPPLNPLFTEETNNHPNVSFILGVEIDEPYVAPKFMRKWHWSRPYEFIQYTMYAPRRFSPILRKTIVRVLAHSRQHMDRWTIIPPRYDEPTVLEISGPGVVTDAVIDSLSETLPPAHPLVNLSVEADEGVGDLLSSSGVTQRRVTWVPFHNIKEPVYIDASEAVEGKAMGGLGVLPVSTWGNGQRHSNAEGFRGPNVCINHRFGGSWKINWWHRMFG